MHDDVGRAITGGCPVWFALLDMWSALGHRVRYPLCTWHVLTFWHSAVLRTMDAMLLSTGA
eukprot:13135650-Alexandrium_andersonii.AAC.1